MREKRNPAKPVAKHTKGPMSELESSLLADIPRLTPDEQAALRYILDRILVVGRRDYSPWVAKGDQRNMESEIADELADAVVYTGMRSVMRAVNKQRLIEQFKAAQADHWDHLVANDQCTDCGVDVFPQKAATAVSELTQQLAESFEEEQTGEHKFARAQTCDDCDAPRTEPHADDCAWVTVVPGAVS